MKKSDITPQILEKCKELAEFWRMKLYYGAWVYTSDVCLVRDEECLVFYRNIITEGRGFPIPDIADILQKLHCCGYTNLTIESDFDDGERWRVLLIEPLLMGFDEEKHEFSDSSLLLALLSALLEAIKQ